MKAAIGMVLALLAGAAHAQAPEPRIQAGDRVRYRVGKQKTLEAAVLEAGPEWLRVEDGRGGSRRFEKADLSALDLYRGKRRNPVAGALIGFLPGAFLGALAAGSACEADSPCSWGTAALVVGGMGAAVGAGIGALVKTDRWQPMPLDRVRFGIAPQRGGMRAALTLSF